MPELPEVETVCRGLRGFLPQHPLAEVTVRRRDLRVPIPPDFEQRLLGRTVLRVERRAKYILWYLDSDDVVLVHLGMSGRLFGYRHRDPKRPQAAAKHDHVWLRTDDDTLICFCDPRRFGLFTVCHSSQLAGHPLLKDLGIEPLSPQLTPQYLRDHLLARRVPVKVALLNQAVVVGIGNIYASEILHLAHTSPERSASELTTVQLKWAASRTSLLSTIEKVSPVSSAAAPTPSPASSKPPAPPTSAPAANTKKPVPQPYVTLHAAPHLWSHCSTWNSGRFIAPTVPRGTFLRNQALPFKVT